MCQGSKNRPTYVQGTNRGTSSRTLKVVGISAMMAAFVLV